MADGFVAGRSAVHMISAALIVSAISLAGVAAPVRAVPPLPTDTTSVIEVFVGADRESDDNVTGLAGVTLQLHDGGGQGPTTPVTEPWATCVSDETGSCFFVVPDTQAGGPNFNRRLWVVRTGTPAGWFGLDALMLGGDPRAPVPYRFRTPGMTAGDTFSSGDEFMDSSGDLRDPRDSSGIWQTSRDNPPASRDCGRDIALILDLSIPTDALPSTDDFAPLRDAVIGFVEALEGTPSRVALVTSPARLGPGSVNRPLTPVSTPTSADVVTGWIRGFSEFPVSAGTNWDAGLLQAAQHPGVFDEAILITDRPPTASDLGPAPGGLTRFFEMEAAILSANAVKAEGTHIVAMQVPTGPTAEPPASLQAVSGPVAESDYFQLADYGALAEALRQWAQAPCRGTVSVVKQVVPSTSPPGTVVGAAPAGGWEFAATIPGGEVNPPSATTGVDTGAVNFADLRILEPVTIEETLQPGFTLQQVNGLNATCRVVGDVVPVAVANVGANGFTINRLGAGSRPVTCTVYNRARPPSPPTAVADAYSTAEDTTLTVTAPGVLGNDSDPDGDALTAVVGTAPGHAAAFTLNPDGSFSYTPAADYHGPDSFTYTASDGQTASAPVTVELTVTAVNDTPTAVADAYSTAEDTTLTVTAPGVLGNDSDPDGDALTAVVGTAPGHAAAFTLNPDGSFSYTPAADYHGPDSFTYTASDGQTASAPVTVELTVTAVNDTPTAVADAYSTAEDTTLTVTAPGVLGNDSDPDGDALTAVVGTAPGHAAAFTLNPDGSFSYTPAADYHGPDSFTYTASDGQTASAPVTVELTVTAVNDTPTAVADAYSTAEDTTLTVTAPGVLGNDSDPDGDALTAVVGTAPGHAAAFTLNPDGSFSYTPAADYHGPDSFTYTASDGQTASAPVTVELTVTAVNDTPTAVADAYSTAEDTTLTVTAPGVLGNDSDPDGDALTAVVGTAPGHAAAFTLNPDGSFSYTPAADYHGPDSFTYTASDGQTASAPVTVELTVTAVNDTPTAVPDAYTTSADNVLTVPAPGLLGNDSDPDGDPLTATLAGAPASGMVMLNPDGSFTYTPNAGFLGTDSFTYWSSDPAGASDQATVTITVSEPVPAGCTIVGTPGNDFLIGGRGNDVICGLGGKDTVYGGPGDDIVDGGSGDDFLIGGPGNDVIRGSAGDDTLYGDPGADTVDGGSGNDTVDGGAGIDAVLGGSGNDRLLGGPGDDTLDGGIGNDVAAGGFGNDRITGGAGADRLYGEFGNDTLLGADGVAGNDTVSGGFGTDMCTADTSDLVIGCP